MEARESKTKLSFGYNRGLPEGVTAAWGCRAIAYQDGTVDPVWDRSDAFGPDEPRKALLDYLADTVGSKPFDRAGELLRTYEMKTREEGEFVLYEDDVVIVKGSTNASAGYLYVSAYRREDVRATEEQKLAWAVERNRALDEQASA